MTFRAKLFAGLIALPFFFPTLGRADSDSFRIFGGGGYASSGTTGDRYPGGKIIGGIRFPSLATDRQAIRASVARTIDSSPTQRYSLPAHVGYRIADPLEIALTGGVGVLHRPATSGTYLKPLIGVEIVSLFATRGSSTLSAFLAYEVFQGSTGSIALDGGTNDLAAKTISAGLVLSFSLFRDPGVGP